MSVDSEFDRWKALADELGLPPEPAQPRASPPPAAPEAPVASHVPPAEMEVIPLEEPEFDEAPARDRLADEMPEEPIDLPPITSLDPPMLDPMVDAPPERVEELREDPGTSPEFEREGGRGGRRGQRGRRGRGERSEGGDDRARRGGRGRRQEPPVEPEPDFEPEANMDEEVETVPATRPAFEEDDDFVPEDNLADLSVPSWSDLIASLYRPDR